MCVREGSASSTEVTKGKMKKSTNDETAKAAPLLL